MLLVCARAPSHHTHAGDRHDAVYIGSHDADVSFCPGSRTHFELLARRVRRRQGGGVCVCVSGGGGGSNATACSDDTDTQTHRQHHTPALPYRCPCCCCCRRQGLPDHVVWHPGALGLPGLEVEPRFFAQVGAGRLALPKK